MLGRRIGTVAASFVVTLIMMLAFAPRVPAQAMPPAGTGMEHDISGVWSGGGGAPPAKIAAMTAAAQTRFDSNTRELKEDRPITIDPAFNCHPPGIPHAYNNGVFAMEIVQTPQRIYVFFESAHQWREIWMDGRKMPEGGDPLWNGYAVGHWEGDELVVNTANFNDLTWLDPAGHPHTEKLKLTERYKRTKQDALQIVTTVDDPDSYTEPWTVQRNYQLRPTWEIMEAFCVPEDQSNFEKNVLAPNAKPTPVKKAAPAKPAAKPATK